MRSPASASAANVGPGSGAHRHRRLPHWIQPVAGAAHGHDLEAELAEAPQLFPQPADVDVDGLAVAEIVVAPELLEEDLASQEPAWPADPAGQPFPFFGGESQPSVVDHGAVPGPVDHEPAQPVLLV